VYRLRSSHCQIARPTVRCLALVGRRARDAESLSFELRGNAAVADPSRDEVERFAASARTLFGD
jgi:hypothetical protein